jgi:hypothetical protein
MAIILRGKEVRLSCRWECYRRGIGPGDPSVTVVIAVVKRRQAD